MLQRISSTLSIVKEYDRAQITSFIIIPLHILQLPRQLSPHCGISSSPRYIAFSQNISEPHPIQSFCLSLHQGIPRSTFIGFADLV